MTSKWNKIEHRLFSFITSNWRGGDHTQLEFPKMRRGHQRVTDSDLVEGVRKLARIESDARIASILNRNRQPTPHGQQWTAQHVCSLRRRNAIPVYRDGEREARGELFVGEAADRLGETVSTVLRWIHPQTTHGTRAICQDIAPPLADLLAP